MTSIFEAGFHVHAFITLGPIEYRISANSASESLQGCLVSGLRSGRNCLAFS